MIFSHMRCVIGLLLLFLSAPSYLGYSRSIPSWDAATSYLCVLGGEWISTPELEDHTMSHPAVHQVAVVGFPHPKYVKRTCFVSVYELML